MLDYGEKRRAAMTPEQREKAAKRPPSTDKQKLAQKENFAIFQIKSMISGLHHLKGCATVPQSSVLSVENTLRAIEKKIKLEQRKRKEAKNGQAKSTST